MKKFLAIALSLILVVSLCACGNNSDKDGIIKPKVSLENLAGEFKAELPAFTMYITFHTDGTVSVKEVHYGGQFNYSGKFEVNGDKITFYEMDLLCPITNGEYPVAVDGNVLMIDSKNFPNGRISFTFVG